MHLYHYQTSTESSALYLGWALRIDGLLYPLEDFSLADWLHVIEDVEVALADLRATALQAEPISEEAWAAARLLPPVDEQWVWAAGVTYERSREARQEEAQDGGDIYARVYGAKRPELFFKALPRHVVGDGEAVAIRRDSEWNVPEPELGILFTPRMQAIGFTVGNDMSSRSIEGENPLYLPQAKVYDGACALGPALWLHSTETLPHLPIRITLTRGAHVAFMDETNTSRIRRTLAELADYLGRALTHPDGVMLLTGTGIIPPGEFTLAAGDDVMIEIEGIGTLTNTVKII